MPVAVVINVPGKCLVTPVLTAVVAAVVSVLVVSVEVEACALVAGADGTAPDWQAITNNVAKTTNDFFMTISSFGFSRDIPS